MTGNLLGQSCGHGGRAANMQISRSPREQLFPASMCCHSPGLGLLVIFHITIFYRFAAIVFLWLFVDVYKLDGVGPVDNRPSTG